MRFYLLPFALPIVIGHVPANFAANTSSGIATLGDTTIRNATLPPIKVTV